MHNLYITINNLGSDYDLDQNLYILYKPINSANWSTSNISSTSVRIKDLQEGFPLYIGEKASEIRIQADSSNSRFCLSIIDFEVPVCEKES